MELVTWAAVYPKSSEPVTHYYHAHQERVVPLEWEGPMLGLEWTPMAWTLKTSAGVFSIPSDKWMNMDHF